MKVLHIITELDKIYGAQRHVVECVKNHLQHNHTCVVITGKSGNASNQITNLGVPVISIGSIKNSYNPLYDILALPKLIKQIKTVNPDLVVAHSSKASIVSRIACYLLKKPNIFTVHGWSFELGVSFMQRIIGLWVERRMRMFSDSYHCVSESTAKFGKQQLHLTTKNVFVCPNLHVPNIVSIEAFKLHNKVLMVAEFRQQKDHTNVIKAWHLLQQSNQTIKPQLVLVGDGSLRKQIEAQIEMLQLNNVVVLAGETTDIQQYYQQCDVVILTSFYEGLPISLVEALQNGKPIIASNVGGNKEIIDDGINGYILKDNNPETIAQVVTSLYHNRALMQKMGEKSREKYQSKFLYHTIDAKMNAIFIEAIASSRFKLS